MTRPQPRSRSSDEEDPISLWLRDSLSQAQSALASAGSMGWSESQTHELEREVDFFAALVRPSPNPPRPPDHVLQHVRRILAMFEERAQKARRVPGLSLQQIARLDAYLGSIHRVRRVIEQFD